MHVHNGQPSTVLAFFFAIPSLRIKMPETQPALTQRRERNDCVKAKRSPLSPDVFLEKSKSYKSGDNSD
ncbi:hypothetical protein [Paenibacillus sp. OK060]|uniref:hypothetical protein n=1 Tax=Paenibacillus sp. OK060 TaxID=1881034 RepID=UPI0015A10A90|nr:hypothetical protein [Paenibacillus sp. OK060]